MKTLLKQFSILLISSLLFTACSQKMQFAKSVVVPGASGTVTLGKDGNSNYEIGVAVKDLTDPKNLVPAKQTYVVWNESDNGVKNIGQLDSERSFLHRGYKASLHALANAKPKRVFITAEDAADVTQPSTQVVLTTN